jgi:hypothetical protein
MWQARQFFKKISDRLLPNKEHLSKFFREVAHPPDQATPFPL